VTPQQVAEPVGWPAAATVAECANCGQRITRRLAEPAARWRHDNGAVTCDPTAPAFDHLVKGDSA
jgi:hypothetical protein